MVVRRKEEDLLTVQEIKFYDMIKINGKVNEIYRLFLRYQDIDINLPLPSITSDYRIRYEQFCKSIKNSKVEKYVHKKMMLEARMENERTEFLSKVTLALRTLSEIELSVFKLSFYERKTEEEISNILNRCKKSVAKIRRSAYIRFLIRLGLDDECLN